MLSHGININSLSHPCCPHSSLCAYSPLLYPFPFSIVSLAQWLCFLCVSSLSPGCSLSLSLSALCLLLDCPSVCLCLCARVLTREREFVLTHAVVCACVCVCACRGACWQSEVGGGTDRRKEGGREKKRDRGEIRWGERGWAHRTAPQSHFPVEVFPDDRHWGEERLRRTEQHSPKHREDRGRGKRRGEARSMCWFRVCQPDTGSCIEPAGKKNTETELFSSPLLWIRKAQPWTASLLALERSDRLIALSRAGARDDDQSDRHVTDRNNHFLAAPGVDWTLSGRS